MSNEFDLPDFMEENEGSEKNENKPFFESNDPQGQPSVVFVFEAAGVPITPDGEIEPPKFKKITEEELIGVYIATNAMMNILIDKGIVTSRELSIKIQEIKKAYLDSKKQ